MEIIRDFALGKAHEQAIMRVCKKGNYVVTQDNEETIELNEPLNIFVATPLNEPLISPKNKFGEKAMRNYADQLLFGSNNDFAYTYHDRLFNYPDNNNQIETIIDELLDNPTSRRAQAITWIPSIDLRNDNPPCLQRIQILLRNGKLNMHVDFRSRDILSAMGANMYALIALQTKISKRLDAAIGWYSDTSTNAHIYFKRDIEELTKYYNPFSTGQELCMEFRKHV